MRMLVDEALQVGEQYIFAQRGADTDTQMSDTEIQKLPELFFAGRQ